MIRKFSQMIDQLSKGKMILMVLSILPLFLFIISCQETGTSPNGESAEVIFEPDTSDTNRIFIRDNTGKKWDVTHAVNKYGFDPENFRHGLGPFAIRPLLEPRYLSPGDPNFNSLDENTSVIGTSINGIIRAYPLYIIGRYEIIDEEFDRTFVAIGY